MPPTQAFPNDKGKSRIKRRLFDDRAVVFAAIAATTTLLVIVFILNAVSDLVDNAFAERRVGREQDTGIFYRTYFKGIFRVGTVAGEGKAEGSQSVEFHRLPQEQVGGDFIKEITEEIKNKTKRW